MVQALILPKKETYNSRDFCIPTHNKETGCPVFLLMQQATHVTSEWRGLGGVEGALSEYMHTVQEGSRSVRDEKPTKLVQARGLEGGLGLKNFWCLLLR